MKTLYTGIMFFLSIANTSFAQSDFLFSVNSSPAINMGIKIEKLVITIGADFQYNYDKNTLEILGNTSTNEHDVFVISPGLGLKWYLTEGDISPFLSANISRQIPLAVKVSGDLNTEKDIKDRYDDMRYRAGGGVDFRIKESLLIGFEIGAYISPRKYTFSSSENKSLLISTIANVTLTYIFE